MRAALQDARAARLSVLVNSAEAEEITRRAAAAGLSVSAYLRAAALSNAASPDEQEAMAIFDRLLDEINTTLDQANNSLEATLSRIDALHT
jgi:hypothetical protein